MARMSEEERNKLCLESQYLKGFRGRSATLTLIVRPWLSAIADAYLLHLCSDALSTSETADSTRNSSLEGWPGWTKATSDGGPLTQPGFQSIVFAGGMFRDLIRAC